MGTSSYYDTFLKKYRQCNHKKDYKKLCKEMLHQLDIIDKLDENQEKILSNAFGEDTYSMILATAIKMYLLDQQGIPYELLTIDPA